MKKILVILTFILMLFRLSAQDSITTSTNTTSISKLEISVSSANVTRDVELTKSLVDLRKTVDRTVDFYNNLEKTSNAILGYINTKQSVLDILCKNNYLPRDRINTAISKKSNIERYSKLITFSTLSLYAIFILLSIKKWNQYFLNFHLGIFVICTLLSYYILSTFFNQLLNPDYEYIKELIRLSG